MRGRCAFVWMNDSRACPLTVACQTFVTNEGAMSRAIAFGKLNATTKTARLIVRRPRPMTL